MFHILDWDSCFFGFPVARIIAPSLNREELDRVLDHLAGQQVVLVYWNVAVADSVSCRAAAGRGRLVEDKLWYVTTVNPSGPPPAGVESFGSDRSTSDLEQLALLSGVYSRFKVDPDITRPKFEALYLAWIRAAVKGEFADTVLVVRTPEGRIVGLITVVEQDGYGRIGLLAVDPGYRGQGLGKALVAGAGYWCSCQGLILCRVATQRNNVPARALYEYCGYGLEKSEQVFHFWRRDRPGRS